MTASVLQKNTDPNFNKNKLPQIENELLEPGSALPIIMEGDERPSALGGLEVQPNLV
jgi:hypothetical protein